MSPIGLSLHDIIGMLHGVYNGNPQAIPSLDTVILPGRGLVISMLTHTWANFLFNMSRVFWSILITSPT